MSNFKLQDAYMSTYVRIIKIMDKIILKQIRK